MFVKSPGAVWTLVVLVGCAPITVRYPGEATVDELPSSADPHPDDPERVGVEPIGLTPVRCERPDLRETLGAFQRNATYSPPAAPNNWLWASGLAAGDFDHDGFVDVVSPSEEGAAYYKGHANGPPSARNDLSRFELSMGIGGSVADYDSDGDIDLVVLRWNRPLALIRNNGPGHFENVTEEAGIGVVGETMSSSWADYDGDGDLDLFVAGYGDYHEGGQPSPSTLFENQGDGTFVDASGFLPPEAHDGFTLSAGFYDIDGDGWLDLYLVNDMSRLTENMVLRNVPREGGRKFARAHGLHLDLDRSGTGLAVADLNGDRRPDFLLPQWHRLSLLISEEAGNGDLFWVDYAAARGLVADHARDQSVGWGAALADIDNDADLDAVVAYGHANVGGKEWDNPIHQPDGLYLQNEGGAFEDVAFDPWWGFDDAAAERGVVVADMNGDGWLDVAKRNLMGPDVLYTARCGEEGWLAVQLSAYEGNTFAVGARVEVLLEDGSELIRWVRAGGTGFGSGGPPSVHFGLGDRDSVRRLRVYWPDGAWHQFDDVPARHMVTITRT